MFKVSNHQGHANENLSGAPLYTREWLKLKKKNKKTLTSADENAESLEPLKLLMGLCNSASTLENSLEVSQNLNHSY